MSMTPRLQTFLDERGVSYQTLDHPESYTAQETAGVLHVPGKELAKVVILKADDQFAMAVLPAPFKVDLDALAYAVGADHAELATESEIRRLFPDCEVGAMPPFGNLYGLPVWADVHLREDAEIIFEAGTHRDAVRMRESDFERAARPRFYDLAMKAA